MTLSISSFVVVTMALFAGLHVASRLWRRDSARARQRISEEFDRPRAHATGSLFKDVDAMSLAPAQEYALLAPSVRAATAPPTAKWRQRLQNSLRETKVPLSLQQLAVLSLVLGSSLGLVTGLYLSWWLAPIAAGMGAVAPTAVVRHRRQSQRDRLLNQLPAAFELMARVIRAGQSVPQAFQAVAEAFEEPLAAEFGGCQQQQKLGLRPEVVLEEMANRNDIVELRIFVMAMAIQRQTGGNLSEVLDRLATLIRGRIRLRHQVRALTAEGRMQAKTLMVLPFIVFAAMFVLNRQYAQALLDHPSLIAATAGLMIVGAVVIRRIVNFDV